MIRRYLGNDNYGHPKADYIASLHGMTEEQLRDACKQMIWLSTYAGNNPRSDYHWKVVACYDECERRKRPNIYKRAYSSVSKM